MLTVLSQISSGIGVLRFWLVGRRLRHRLVVLSSDESKHCTGLVKSGWEPICLYVVNIVMWLEVIKPPPLL